MATAKNIQSLLRFLSQDAKVPLAQAMTKVSALQEADLPTPEKLAETKPKDLQPIFEDQKICKQVIAAAKRACKKRPATNGDENPGSSPKKKQRNESLFPGEPAAIVDLEYSLRLPTCSLGENDLKEVVLFTNRAPLVLAFLVVSLKHTMPEQPLSTRLSLSQAYVSATSKSRAIYLGIEGGKSTEEEGFGEGQPSVIVGGKEIKVLRRWGYEWKEDGAAKNECDVDDREELPEEQPALWALDLEALKKADNTSSFRQSGTVGTHSNLPVHSPQSARAYLLKAFDTAPLDGTEAPIKKPTAAAKVAEKESNLGKLLRALELLYDSWASMLSPNELDNRTWNWYVKVRPAVAEGPEGWGGKNRLKLADVLALRRSD